MEYNPDTRTFLANKAEKTVLDLPELAFAEDDAFDVMAKAVSRRYMLTSAHALGRVIPFGGSHTQKRQDAIQNNINVLDGAIKCLGDHISLDAATQEIEDFVNGQSQ